jgi:hypothetical protein
MMENLYRLFINNPQWSSSEDSSRVVKDIELDSNPVTDKDPVVQDWSSLD